MQGTNSWSYRPYRPFLTDAGDICICRIVPHIDGIHLEWLPAEENPYSVFCRKRGESQFLFCCSTSDTFCDIEDLSPDTDYEFYVATDTKKSRVRLARCGRSVGTVVNYLHPDDMAYAFSGRYLCSPSLVRHPGGFLLASMDLFAPDHPQNLTLIFRSDDNGETWKYVSELMPCFWGKMFIHKGELYMLAVSTEYGDLLIGKSTDGGKSFSAPTVLLRGSGGKNGNCGIHKNPQNILCYGGRLYTSLEWGTWQNKEFGHAAMVMSCAEDDDLLAPESWHFSKPVPFDAFTPELQDLPKNTMTIEGTLAVDPTGRMLNIMRFGKYHTALAYAVNTNDPDAPLTFSHLIEFPANYSKFTIKQDPETGMYYSIGTRVYDPEYPGARDLLSLLRSPDLRNWKIVCDLMDYRGIDRQRIGFQYVDFEMEGDDILYLCRTALNDAHNFHDANYSTFHRIKAFRTL